MVPDLRESMVRSEARVVVTLNLDEQAGETPGFEAADHLAVLAEHAPDLRLHTVLADSRFTARPVRGQSGGGLPHRAVRRRRQAPGVIRWLPERLRPRRFIDTETWRI